MKIFRNKVVLIGIVCLAPVLAGWALYLSGWRPAETGNYGELIAPRPLSGAPFDALRGKWVLATFDTAACDAYCERKLYFMRQVRRTQGKEMGRIERLWAITDGGKPRPELLAAIEGTRVAALNDQAFSPDYIYLIDPLGNLMLRFPRDPDPSRMVKDLQRLLRYSRIG
jgi:hypothetical protein